ncbi:MAG: sensor histidine kinase [Ferruginibacter sp.]
MPSNSLPKIRRSMYLLLWKPGKLLLSVKDSGIGISMEDQEHLMERFFRGSNATNIQGTGLGLHIVSKYAELMNGTVICNSELEKGTTFTVSFKTLN